MFVERVMVTWTRKFSNIPPRAISIVGWGEKCRRESKKGRKVNDGNETV